MEKESYNVSWEEIHSAMVTIAAQLKNSFKQYDEIVPVARGGLVPATILSHLLSLPIRKVLFVSSYTDTVQSKVTVIGPVMIDHGANKLFVDDIVDTGNTIKEIVKHYSNARFVAPVGKVPGIESVADKLLTMSPIMAESGVWINFPWE